MKKLNLILLLLGCAGIVNPVIAQGGKPSIARVYEEAERLYRNGHYGASLAYIKRESGDWINTSDTLMYIRIKNLDQIFRLSFNETKELESTLQRFFARVNRNTFPELKYSEVSTIYTNFQSFKEKDRAFHDSVSRSLDLNKVEKLMPLKQVISDYVKAYPNSYYTKEMNEQIHSINNRLLQEELTRKKRERDSLHRDALKKVGKLLSFNLTFSVPQDGKTVFTGLDNYDEVVNFFDGRYTGFLGEKYSLGASLGETFINIYTGRRVKFGLNWSIFDGEYSVFDWTINSLISEKQTTNQPIKELKSIKVGTRIGPVVAILATRSVSIAPYYSVRPGIQFLTGKTYFSESAGTVNKIYEIKPSMSNFNLSHEIGVKFYFFKKVFIGPYMHFGSFNWQNDITDVSTGGGGSMVKAQADYDFKFMGVRIGF